MVGSKKLPSVVLHNRISLVFKLFLLSMENLALIVQI